MGHFTIRSRLAASPETVWAHAAQPEGIAYELGPFLRMTFPDDVPSIETLPASGERVFRSWILLFGLLPVEYDDLAFEAIEPGRRFLERSSMATQREWVHERIVESAGAGALLEDRLAFRPRLAWTGPIAGALFRAVFSWRHRRLRRRFGGEPA